MQLPNVWGKGGALFAFSGMDGETDWCHPLVGSTVERGRGFIFHSPGTPVLRAGVRTTGQEWLGDSESCSAVQDEIVAGGLVISQIQVGQSSVRLEFVAADKRTVLGRMTAQAVCSPIEVFLQSVPENSEPTCKSGTLVQRVGEAAYALACNSEDAHCDAGSGRVYAVLDEPGQSVVFAWVYAVGASAKAADYASSALKADFQQLVERQLDYFRDIPEPETPDDSLARTYYKAASVLKVNCCSPQGDIPFPFTTPDRWPHQHMWIWDSAFHAIGLRHISAQWAQDAVRAVLACQREDGFIPHTMTPDRSRNSRIIQPPILAWAAWKVYQTAGNPDFLHYVYPRVCRMIDYDTTVLDTDNNGLSEWGDRNASGMDNSPRFDTPVKDAVDLNSYLVSDMRYLARIAAEIGKHQEASAWEQRAQERADRINELLWDDATGFYYDSAPDGSLIKLKSVAGFTPLFARVCDRRRAEELTKHLFDPDKFWRAFPVATVSADEPSFSDNMWRGPTWVNYNYFLIEALKHYGYLDKAEQLRKRTIQEISRWYVRNGVIYEFYDCEAAADPILLHRKDKGGPGAGKSRISLGTNVCDYNWTAALYIDLLSAR